MIGEKEFSEPQVKIIKKLASEIRPQHSADWLRQRMESLLAKQVLAKPASKWGWKEPNTHILLDQLQRVIPDLKYIHVVRNGLDMAHSTNQNQLKFWGSQFLGADYEISPYYSLRYWHTVHQHVIAIGESMGPRFLLFNNDDFCLNPTNSIDNLLSFLEVDVSDTQISNLLNLVRIPKSIGRFKKYSLEIFDPSDIKFVEELGFDTSIK